MEDLSYSRTIRTSFLHRGEKGIICPECESPLNFLHQKGVHLVHYCSKCKVRVLESYRFQDA